MSDNTIYKSIRRSNINLIIISIIALAIAIGIGVYSSLPYFLAKFSSPTKLDEKALAGITADAAPMYFQQIAADVVFDSGYEEYTEYENGSQRTDAYFALAMVGDHIVMVRLRDRVDESQDTYVGAFVRPSSIQSEIFTDFERELPDDVENLVPLVFDTIDKEFNWYGDAAVLLVLLLGGLWGVVTFFQRNANPKNHPTLKKLATYGDVDKVIDSIDKELGSMPEEVGKLKLTRNWVVQSSGSTFEAIPYRDVVWAYKMIQTGKYNTKTYYAHIGDKHGKMLAILAKEEQVNQMLQAVMSHAPWAFAGYNDELKKAWDKDRQQLVTAVEQRKAQYDAQSSGM
jgi:hypothetical protein